MAITTINGKLSIMEWCQVWEPGLPMSPGTLDQADFQQFLWDFTEVLYQTGGAAFILDLNTRLFVYLQPIYGGNDLTSMIARNLAGRSGDYDKRFRDLIDDATP